MTAAATIRRGGGARRKASGRKVKTVKPPSMLTRARATIPLTNRTIERLVTAAVLVVGVVALVAIVVALGLPQRAGQAAGEAIGRAGLVVKRVEVTGVDRMDRLTVYAIALDQQSMAMPLVDLGAVRAKLLRYGWVADAQVSRRLPDTLVVNLIERRPAAVWQHNSRLHLIDDQGVVLERVQLDAMPDLPLVVGPDANVQATALAVLTAEAPQLEPMLASATWVGGRRWDLRFQSGEVLALPEGGGEAGRALQKFAAMDASERLLGRGFARFDLRDPAKMVVRLGAARGSIDKPGTGDRI